MESRKKRLLITDFGEQVIQTREIKARLVGAPGYRPLVRLSGVERSAL